MSKEKIMKNLEKNAPAIKKDRPISVNKMSKMIMIFLGERIKI